MRFVEHDGGRADAGYRGRAGDCATRAIAIAADMPYQVVYDGLKAMAARERITKRNPKRSSIRDGTARRTMNRYMDTLPHFVWIPTMTIGSGCRVHMRADELPRGDLIVSLSGHYAAVRDGVLYDTHDCTREGTRCVYGYWQRRSG